MLCVNLSVSFFIRIFIRFNRFSNSSINSFNFPSVLSLIWSFVYSFVCPRFQWYIVSVGFVYPIVPSLILSIIRRPIGPFTRRNGNSFYFRACIVMFADNHLLLKKHCAISFIHAPLRCLLKFLKRFAFTRELISTCQCTCTTNCEANSTS